MSEFNFSHGPWKVIGSRTAFPLGAVESAIGEVVADGIGKIPNAALIAAAPDLLAACRDALALIQDPDAEPADADRVESILLAAIARAEGQ